MTTGEVAEHSIRGTTVGISLHHVIYLYQALSLYLTVNQSTEDIIRQTLITQHSILKEITTQRQSEYVPYTPATSQINLAHAVRSLLRDEPYVVQCNELLHGFETEVMVKLNPKIKFSLLGSDEPWSPMLNIEVNYAGCDCPAVVRYTILRDRYLMNLGEIAVERIANDEIEGKDLVS